MVAVEALAVYWVALEYLSGTVVELLLMEAVVWPMVNEVEVSYYQPAVLVVVSYWVEALWSSEEFW